MFASFSSLSAVSFFCFFYGIYQFPSSFLIYKYYTVVNIRLALISDVLTGIRIRYCILRISVLAVVPVPFIFLVCEEILSGEVKSSELIFITRQINLKNLAYPIISSNPWEYHFSKENSTGDLFWRTLFPEDTNEKVTAASRRVGQQFSAG